jgi:anti-anti-sigma factor
MSEHVYVQVETDTGAGIALATVKCEMIAAREAPIIEAEVKAGAKTRGWKILMDLKEVTILASMGLGMLVNLNKACAAEGGKLVVCNVAPDILGVLKITRLDGILKIVPDLEAGKKLLK